MTAADISGRLEEWIKAPAIFFPPTAMVYLDGKSLKERPSPTNRSHSSVPRIIPIKGKRCCRHCRIDPELKDYPGIYVGLYRVRISKKVDGKETIPARYNTKTELGREVATNIATIRANVMFRLKSK